MNADPVKHHPAILEFLKLALKKRRLPVINGAVFTNLGSVLGKSGCRKLAPGWIRCKVRTRC